MKIGEKIENLGKMENWGEMEKLKLDKSVNLGKIEN